MEMKAQKGRSSLKKGRVRVSPRKGCSQVLDSVWSKEVLVVGGCEGGNQSSHLRRDWL